MAQKTYLAMDFGASSGRGLLGRFDGETIRMEEIYRFPNHLHHVNHTYCWDILELLRHTKQILSRAAADGIDGAGIDTWGLDYGLLDANGDLLGQAISYRNSLPQYAEAAWEQVPQQELFRCTGTGHLVFNTIYQLYERRLKQDPALDAARCLLLLPDLLGYFLTGERSIEYTNALTTMMVDHAAGDWARDLLARLRLPAEILPPIIKPSTLKGSLLPELGQELSLGTLPIYSVASHDTASAIAAIPARSENFAYISSGTWSLVGTECSQPILSDAAYAMGFSNEGSLQGRYRVNRNIAGMLLIQACREEWKTAADLTWDAICEMAAREQPFASLIDPNDARFLTPGHTTEKIQSFCAETRQAVPETFGQLARCVYESLALSYRKELRNLREITGKVFDAVHIVGGGCRNTLLNQFTANAAGLPVYAGPVESACAANALSQAMAQGELHSVAELREVVRRSEPVLCFEPQDTVAWDEAAARFTQIAPQEGAAGHADVKV